MEPPADRVRSVRFPVAFRYVCLAAAIWTVFLLSIYAVKSSVAPTIVTVLGGIVSAVVAIIGIFQLPRVKIDLKSIRGVVIAVLLVDVVVSVVWPLVSYYPKKRDIDTLSMVTLSQNVGVLPGHPATFDGTIAETRDTLVLVFKVQDNNPHIGSTMASGCSEVITRTA